MVSPGLLRSNRSMTPMLQCETLKWNMGGKKKRKEKNPENIEWGVCVLFL